MPTQEELPQRADLHVRAIRRLEGGMRSPRITSVRLLAVALGLDDAERALLTAAAAGWVYGLSSPVNIALFRGAALAMIRRRRRAASAGL
ncbi:helix-turn-helix domain-containing protein [Nonomuraea basaltis]|uniref:helix-turn-helix domain-containing protein n=1 Tax=Nonomuraea basaltis TaxID=2495887 RepID=UPI001486AC7A|nr:helix-turn-helix transcriptional regulator [Nonomuraea basaltis]